VSARPRAHTTGSVPVVGSRELRVARHRIYEAAVGGGRRWWGGAWCVVVPARGAAVFQWCFKQISWVRRGGVGWGGLCRDLGGAWGHWWSTRAVRRAFLGFLNGGARVFHGVHGGRVEGGCAKVWAGAWGEWWPLRVARRGFQWTPPCPRSMQEDSTMGRANSSETRRAIWVMVKAQATEG
jgi:hypothetical protein